MYRTWVKAANSLSFSRPCKQEQRLEWRKKKVPRFFLHLSGTSFEIGAYVGGDLAGKEGSKLLSWDPFFEWVRERRISRFSDIPNTFPIVGKYLEKDR